MPDPVELLRTHGLRVTSQRLAVLRAVARRPHCTAETVADEVRAEIGAISKQAVYDALAALTDRGLLRRIQPAGSPARFDPRIDDHHHVVCRACGKATDIDAVAAPPSPTGVDPAYRIEAVEVTYWGTCPACRAAARPT